MATSWQRDIIQSDIVQWGDIAITQEIEFTSSIFMNIIPQYSFSGRALFEGVLSFTASGIKNSDYLVNVMKHLNSPYFTFYFRDSLENSVNCTDLAASLQGETSTGKLLVNTTTEDENTSLLWTDKTKGEGVYLFIDNDIILYDDLFYNFSLFPK